jgi:tetratricopeptide (TPR) repeat protein
MNPEIARPIYLSGDVKLPDGSSPPNRVVVERVCGASVRPEGYTDSTGHFSFQVSNQNSGLFFDASVSGEDAIRADVPGRQRSGESNLAGCEIRANLSGFLSSSITLGFRRPLDNPHIGTITISPLVSVGGSTFSVTTGLASKDARKAYEKGLDYAKSQKWTEAERELSRAVQIYPNYAIAWFELGKVHQRLKKNDDARGAYRQALQIDPKFVNPYAPLITLQTDQQRWEDVARDFSELMKLSPYPTMDVYFFAAVANYNLNNKDAAERQVREAASLDSQHKIPKINHLFGVILAEKKDYAAARENIQLYLKLSPNAIDADEVRQLLTEIEGNLSKNSSPLP